MPRLGKLGVVAFLIVVGLVMSLPIVSHRHPSTLFVHADSLSWQTVIIESSNLASAVRFERGSPEIRVSPISHGVYRIGIQLTSGQTIWSEFFHSDVGVRRRVDITISTGPGGFHFRQTANQSQELFDGDALSGDATEQKPFRLDWI